MCPFLVQQLLSLLCDLIWKQDHSFVCPPPLLIKSSNKGPFSSSLELFCGFSMVQDLASFCHLSLPLNFEIFIYLLHVWVCTYSSLHVEGKGLLGRIRCLFLPCLTEGIKLRLSGLVTNVFTSRDISPIPSIPHPHVPLEKESSLLTALSINVIFI